MAEPTEIPHRRELFVDETGAGMRVTWHAEQELFVVSLWRDDVCVGAIRLDAGDTARLVAMLTRALASSVSGNRRTA
ncbi:MAG TPA: hypothetical protein VM345_10360 [Acidimicrobiales bacterium]|nr:hypothetical protein [Acidimicrobiales bacterium]